VFELTIIRAFYFRQPFQQQLLDRQVFDYRSIIQSDSLIRLRSSSKLPTLIRSAFSVTKTRPLCLPSRFQSRLGDTIANGFALQWLDPLLFVVGQSFGQYQEAKQYACIREMGRNRRAHNARPNTVTLLIVRFIGFLKSCRY